MERSKTGAEAAGATGGDLEHHAIPPPAWVAPRELETYALPDGRHQRRLVLGQNRHPRGAHPSERCEYAGDDYWDEATWREMENLLHVTTPDLVLREGIRQAIFQYVSQTTPAETLHPDQPESDRIEYVREEEVRCTLSAIERAARLAATLPALLEPLFASPQRECGERNRVRAFLAEARAEWLLVADREPMRTQIAYAQIGYNTFLRDVDDLVADLVRLRPLLERIAAAAPKAAAAVPRSPSGPRGDPALRPLADQLTAIIEDRLGAKTAALSVIEGYSPGDSTGVGGRLQALAELIHPWLPKTPGTLGARKTPVAIGRALQEARSK